MVLFPIFVFRSFMVLLPFFHFQWFFKSRSLRKTKTGCRPFLLIQVDLLVDWKTLPVHLITHVRKIKSKSHLHCQNLHSATFIMKRRPSMERATRFELATPSLGSLYSTTELCPPLRTRQKYYKRYAMSIFFNINFDGFVKSPTSALRCIPRHCCVR